MAGCERRNSQLPDHGRLTAASRKPLTVSGFRAPHPPAKQRLSEVCIQISDRSQATRTRAAIAGQHTHPAGSASDSSQAKLFALLQDLDGKLPTDRREPFQKIIQRVAVL